MIWRRPGFRATRPGEGCPRRRRCGIRCTRPCRWVPPEWRGRHPRALWQALRRDGIASGTIKDKARHPAARRAWGTRASPAFFATPGQATSVAFVHAFRRWTGTPPGRWRARQAARKGGERQITAPATLTASRKPGLPRHADRAIQARTSCSGQGACKDDIIRATWRCPPIRASSGQSLSCKGRRTSRAVRRISGATGVSPASSDRSMSAPAHCARR